MLKPLSHALLLSFITAALWTSGLCYYVSQMPNAPTPDGRVTDAIVVLTGGRNRLEYGLMRLSEGKAKTLFISGVARSVTTADLLRNTDQKLLKGIDTAKLAPQIVLGFEATSTIGNARETTDWLKAQNLHTIRLVTANYHMPRALREFTETAPELTIIADPIFPEDFDRLRWWQSKTSLKLAIAEFHKFLGSKLRRTLLSAKEAG